MVERFAYSTGKLSVVSGAQVVTGVGCNWSGRDREGSIIYYRPSDSPGGLPQPIGIVAAVDPRGVYDATELPLLFPYTGETLTEVDYVIVDGPAIANGATQAAAFQRLTAFLEHDMGLVGNTADNPDYDLAQENSLFVDAGTRTIKQWRNGVLVPVYAVGAQFAPQGEWDSGMTYSINDMVSHEGAIFVSNVDDNTINEPGGSPFPSSDTNWTHLPMASVETVLAALGINKITISTLAPTGGVDGDMWLQVAS